MKQKILTGWNFRRALYTVIGLAIIIQSIMQQQWFGMLLGGYFASMGIFGFGCAAGNCVGGRSSSESINQTESAIQEIAFEEIKHK